MRGRSEQGGRGPWRKNIEAGYGGQQEKGGRSAEMSVQSARSIYRKNLKDLVAGCHSFLFIFIFYTYIHSITFIQYIYPSSFAEASLDL